MNCLTHVHTSVQLSFWRLKVNCLLKCSSEERWTGSPWVCGSPPGGCQRCRETPQSSAGETTREQGAGSEVGRSRWRGEEPRVSRRRDSQWCRGKSQRRARCQCEWPRSDLRWEPPEPEPAGTRWPAGPISSGAGTELSTDKTTAGWQMITSSELNGLSPPLNTNYNL